MHRIGRYVVCVGLFCLTDVSHVAADPVSINSGFLLVTGPFEVGSISISGTQGFSLEARVNPVEGRVDALHLECQPICLPGSTISVGAFQGGASFDEGTATLGGNSYQLSGGVNDPTTVALEFFGTATLPALQTSLLLEVPFNAMGWFSLPGDQIRMSGAGVVSLWLSQGSAEPGFPDSPLGWIVDQVRYDFTDPAPVPEPATLSLLGIGLAATALRARIRGKASAKVRA